MPDTAPTTTTIAVTTAPGTAPAPAPIVLAGAKPSLFARLTESSSLAGISSILLALGGVLPSILPQLAAALGLTGSARVYAVIGAVITGVIAVAKREGGKGGAVVLEAAEDLQTILPFIEQLTSQGINVKVRHPPTA